MPEPFITEYLLHEDNTAMCVHLLGWHKKRSHYMQIGK